VIITCERCATQFQLDEAKIPSGGARVRCSRCEFSFEVESPVRADVDRAEELAHEAIMGAASEEFIQEPSPGVKADEVGFAQEEVPEEQAAVPLGEQATEPSLEDEGADLESDWEFNDDDNIAGARGAEALGESPSADSEENADELFAAQGAVDDLLAGVDAGAFPLDEAADEPAAENDDAESSFELGSSEDLSLDPHAVEPSNDDEASPAIEAAAEPAAVDESADDPSSWDIFDQPSDAPADEISAAQAPIGVPAAATESRTHSEPRVNPAVAVATESAQGSQWKKQLGGIVGWVSVCSLLVAGLVAGITVQPETVAPGTGRWQGGGFVAGEIQGRWLENAVAGPIYVITGQLDLDSAARAAAHTGLQIQLVDDSGRALDFAPSWIGPELPTQILRESAPTAIQALQESRAGDLLASAYGGAPFVAIVEDMPDSAARFKLLAVEADFGSAPY
jgi:predicted Zn finger-like uncharacterized protein